MTVLYPGARVRTTVRRSTGTVVAHDPTLPAWRVDFPEDPAPLAWLEETLEVAR